MTEPLMRRMANGESVLPEPDAGRSAQVEMEHNGHIACPVCGFPIGAVHGSKAAICTNCGFKDGCC
jgi:hypothetical protein